jgi:hypothetical protein
MSVYLIEVSKGTFDLGDAGDLVSVVGPFSDVAAANAFAEEMSSGSGIWSDFITNVFTVSDSDATSPAEFRRQWDETA